jgi:predicted DNA-binding antitoxin AbrB/MazE fold protein
MGTIEAIYEGGVFRPTEPVVLPEKCRVRFEPRVVNGEPAMEVRQDDDMDAIYEILDRRHSTGITDLAARHNEHQP